jgi:DNA-binding transcriptional ArsR family regulator
MKYKCCKNIKLNKEIDNAANLLGIIAEKNRLKILCVLKRGERCVCDIWQDLGIAENLASHHLKILKKAGMIVSRKEGLNVIYSINKEGIKRVNLLLNKFMNK